MTHAQRPDWDGHSVTRTAFVLSGGGPRGAIQIGQLQALLAAGIRPDLVVGTSVGAINGAMLARNPSISVTDELIRAWSSRASRRIYGQPVLPALVRFARRGHLLSNAPLRHLLVAHLGEQALFEDLAIPFHVVATSIESAVERWFSSGPLIPVVLASASVPGVMPPVEFGGEHLFDGGLANSIPLDAALREGADRVFVLHCGQLTSPLRPPRNPVEAASVSFELARRHRFNRDRANLPPGVCVYVLPSGVDPQGTIPRSPSPRSVQLQAETALQASEDYLAEALCCVPAEGQRCTEAEPTVP